jgi:hypothetical protein
MSQFFHGLHTHQMFGIIWIDVYDSVFQFPPISINFAVEVSTHRSPFLEYLMIKCRPFYLPSEFLVVTVTAVYIPP